MFAVANVKPEQGFSPMRRMKTYWRSSISEGNLSTIMRIVMDDVSNKAYSSTGAVNKFLCSNQKVLEKWRRGKRQMTIKHVVCQQ